nr:MAG TPA: putative periplasmic lipoprotein [Crassvirales sp.]
MKDLTYYVEKIRYDKCIHLLICFIIASNVAILDNEIFNRTAIVAASIGSLTAVFIAIVKELIDFFIDKSFDLKDLKFGIIGSIVGFIWSLILILI